MARALFLVVWALSGAGASVWAADIPADPSGGSGGQAGTFPDEQITVGGEAREYRLIVPARALGGQPVPLVFAFHGLFDSKDIMPVYSRLGVLAEDKGFILVFPNGKNRHWPLLPRFAEPDFEFFDALYNRLTAQYNIDKNRVYLTGMSNGAYFSHLLATQRSDKIAAIAGHSGGLGGVGIGNLKPTRKYAVMIIHGESDRIVNVQEGRYARDKYLEWGHPVKYVEVPNLVHFWANNVNINDQIWEFFAAHPRDTAGN